jgi:hypothetical protein
METLFSVFICSFAIAYWAELTRSNGLLKHLIIFLGSVATIPFYPVSWFLIPIVLATAFLSATWIILINAVTSKPQVIPRNINRVL